MARKPIGICGVVDSCLIEGVGEGAKEGETLSEGDRHQWSSTVK